MKVSHNWLQTYFKEPIPSADHLAELFTFHSFEVEGIEEVKDEAGKLIDTVIDVKILPDRAHYALSHKGVAMEVELLAKLSAEVAPRLSDVTLREAISSVPSIKIEDPKFCRRYTSRIVELSSADISVVSDRPAYLKIQKFLIAIGQRSISPIVDATNYVMYDIGQPLHAFDADKVKGALVIRAAKEGEKIVLLDGREITMTSEDHVIADDDGPLVIAGAKGGKRAEISESTKRIIIESANFDPTAVRRTSTKYDIRSDSSKRFENEITADLAIQGMNEISALLQDMMPESKFGPIVDEYPTKAKQTVIEFDPSYIEERLGVKVPLNEAKKILENMGIVVTDSSGSKKKVASDNDKSDKKESGLKSIWSLTIPYDRLDLVISEDIIEEVGRIYGYEHIKGILPPKSEKSVTVLPEFYLAEKIKNILTDAGFSEVSLYTLVEKGHIETLKPLAKDKAFARTNLTDGMIACVDKNALNADLLGLDAIKIFEIGRVFGKEGEEIHLAIGAAQIKKVKGVKSRNIVEEAIKGLNVEASPREIEVSPRYSDSKPPANYCVAEINLSELVKTFQHGESYADLKFTKASVNKYMKFSLYPFITRDIAVFVPEVVEETEVWQTIKKGIDGANASELLVRHSLFDVFRKEGKTSYAFRMVFQAMDRTLTDEEANKIMEAVNGGVKEKGWVVR